MFGLGLRPQHYHDILTTKPTIDFFEAMTEDYFDHPDSLSYLDRIRADYPIALHGVAMSIGNTDPLNTAYLSQLKKLIDHIQPICVSDHICWTGVNQIHLHDLLPLPFTVEAVNHVVSRIRQVQDFLQRQILFENISSYTTFPESEMTEWEFMSEIAQRADCFILLDINNIFVNAFNHGFSAEHYLSGVPIDRVKQFHLAGHKHCQTHIIDTHDANIVDDVWNLYANAVKRFSNVSVVIERDSNIPSLSELMQELNDAKKISDSDEFKKTTTGFSICHFE